MNINRILGATLLATAAVTSQAGFVSPTLQREIASDPNGSSAVVILLRNQPGYMVSRDVAKIYEPEVRRLGQQIREIYRSARMVGWQLCIQCRSDHCLYYVPQFIVQAIKSDCR